MIDAGDVFAEISDRDSMVRFKDDPEAFDTQATADLLDSFIQRSIALSHKTSAINHMVGFLFVRPCRCVVSRTTDDDDARLCRPLMMMMMIYR